MTPSDATRQSARLPVRRQLEQQQQGGGGGTPTLPSVPAATPPVTESSADVVAASQDLRRQALKKRGFSKTYLAGDTGGWFGGETASPVNPKIQSGNVNLPKTLGGT